MKNAFSRRQISLSYEDNIKGIAIVKGKGDVLDIK
jgi:hypothetical protein